MAQSEVKIRTESGLNFLARVTPRESLRGLEPAVFGDAGPLPETSYLLCGESGTGKTLILTQWIAKCILPPKFKDKNLGGLGASVLLINTEHSFSLLRLVALLETRIKQSLRAKRARDASNTQNFTFSPKDVEILRGEALTRLQFSHLLLGRSPALPASSSHLLPQLNQDLANSHQKCQNLRHNQLPSHYVELGRSS